MTITGYQFDKAKVSASKDSLLYYALAHYQDFVISSYKENLSVSVSGLNVTVATGACVIGGRLVEVTAPETISIPANSSGHLVVKVDLSATNTASGEVGGADYQATINQVSIEFATSLTKQDITEDGLVRVLSLGKISSTTSAVTFTKVDTSMHFLDEVYSRSTSVSLGNGVTGFIHRFENTVTLQVSANQTSKRQTTPYVLAERIPAGYRPHTAACAQAVISVGTTIQTARSLQFVFNKDGSILGSGVNMDAAPLTVTVTAQWKTADAFI